ncbi:hypothetical protein Vi05172_g4259 [Venturia inaequalis]|nr:hypothetical protein Vi05172_g4259 [Venturia inaequalis]
MLGRPFLLQNFLELRTFSTPSPPHPRQRLQQLIIVTRSLSVASELEVDCTGIATPLTVVLWRSTVAVIKFFLHQMTLLHLVIFDE